MCLTGRTSASTAVQCLGRRRKVRASGNVLGSSRTALFQAVRPVLPPRVASLVPRVLRQGVNSVTFLDAVRAPGVQRWKTLPVDVFSTPRGRFADACGRNMAQHT